MGSEQLGLIVLIGIVLSPLALAMLLWTMSKAARLR